MLISWLVLPNGFLLDFVPSSISRSKPKVHRKGFLSVGVAVHLCQHHPNVSLGCSDLGVLVLGFCVFWASTPATVRRFSQRSLQTLSLCRRAGGAGGGEVKNSPNLVRNPHPGPLVGRARRVLFLAPRPPGWAASCATKPRRCGGSWRRWPMPGRDSKPGCVSWRPGGGCTPAPFSPPCVFLLLPPCQGFCDGWAVWDHLAT